MDSNLSLAVVGGRASEVDRDVVEGDEAGEVEELVEVALRGQWHHDHLHLVVGNCKRGRWKNSSFA